MTAQRNQSIETSSELPVENLYNAALNGFLQTHAELAKLPQDPSDALQPAEAMLRDIGVDMGTDYSMFIMGAMGNIGMDMGLSALGLPASGAVSMGLDAASGILMGLAEETQNKTKSGPNKKQGATSMFKAVSRPKTDKPLKAVAPNTSILKKALVYKKHLQIKNTAHKRAALKKAMAIHTENLKELLVFKSCGVKYVHKVTVPNAKTGENETYLVAAKDKPHMALTSNGKTYERPIDVSAVFAPQTAPKFEFAA